jgi:CheY-like chemotaxis protein
MLVDSMPLVTLRRETEISKTMITTHFKVLILEDNDSDADLLLRELRKNGLNFSHQIAESRAAFEYALEAFKPDIILSDFYLPSFDGVTAFNIAQNISPDTPFIIVSGTIGEERSVELIKVGITDYILKDKLYVLAPKISRALKDAEKVREKRIADEELKEQYEKLLKIAFMQSHQVRVPVANILGLFNLFEFDDPGNPINGKVLIMLKLVAESLDKTIHEIIQNTGEIKRIIK